MIQDILCIVDNNKIMFSSVTKLLPETKHDLYTAFKIIGTQKITFILHSKLQGPKNNTFIVSKTNVTQ